MKLIGMTLCYNESQMIPYIMPYYERMGFDKLIVYDNESTDNSVELLKKYPFVEVRTFHTGLKRNSIQSELKSNIWKEFYKDPDTWMFISDFDEVLYYKGDFRAFLEQKNKEGYTYLNQQMLELVSDEMPDISDGHLVHEKCIGGVFWEKKYGCKMTLFKVSKTTALTYCPGAHNCKWETKLPKKSLNNKGIISFHIKYIGYDYIAEKMKRAAARRSEEDVKKRYGYQYEKLKKDDEFKVFWNKMKKKLIDIQLFINKNEIKNI